MNEIEKGLTRLTAVPSVPCRAATSARHMITGHAPQTDASLLTVPTEPSRCTGYTQNIQTVREKADGLRSEQPAFSHVNIPACNGDRIQ